MSNPFYIVDVFGEKRYQGNQLAVVNVRNPISDAVMQKFAREINFSETTYILSDTPRSGGYDVRIFTPSAEVPFAGHPTLGTAYVIQQSIIQHSVDQIILNLKAGQIPVDIRYRKDEPQILWMKQINPEFGQQFSPDALVQTLNIKERDFNPIFPIQEVSTGLPFIIVPLKSIYSVNAILVDKDAYYKLIKNTQAKAILVFCPETVNSRNDLHVRVFCDYFGIPEDPATGSANGCLAGYMVKHRYFNTSNINLRVEQGIEMGRPSLVRLQAHEVDQAQIEVRVGGKVIPVARGEIS